MRKRLCHAYCFLFACLLPLHAQQASNNASPAVSRPPSDQFFIEKEKEVWEALRHKDKAAATRLLADDFVGMYDFGFFNKSEWIRQIDEQYTVDDYTILEPKILHPSPTTVLLLYTATCKGTGSWADYCSQTSRISDLWVERNGEWLDLFSQDTVAGTNPQATMERGGQNQKQVSKQGTQKPEAYALYLKGRSYLDKQTLSDLKTAVSYFNQAIAKDPAYALAYSGLARTYAFLPDYGDSPVEDHPKAMAFAGKALELDPTLSEPHLVLGGQIMFQDWDIAGGVTEFKKAIELDPNNAQVHDRYAFNISIVGGMEQEALAEINRAHQLDPLSQDISYDLGFIHIYARRFDEAIAVCKKLANENPTYAGAHDCLAEAYWEKRMYSQSLEEFKIEIQLSGDRSESERASGMEQGFRSGGWKGALRKSIETLQAQRETQPSSAYGSACRIANAYAELGDKDQAFRWLNTAYQEHDEGLMGLKTDYYLDPVRSDPRFAELVRKVGLP